jgi:hypothetical protein
MVIAEAEIGDRFQMKSVIAFLKIRNLRYYRVGGELGRLPGYVAQLTDPS